MQFTILNLSEKVITRIGKNSKHTKPLLRFVILRVVASLVIVVAVGCVVNSSVLVAKFVVVFSGVIAITVFALNIFKL